MRVVRLVLSPWMLLAVLGLLLLALVPAVGEVRQCVAKEQVSLSGFCAMLTR